MRLPLQAIANHKNEPFQWGTLDCCMFTGECIKEVTGIDIVGEYRGRYKTEIGAKRVLAKYGSIEEHLDKHFKRIDYKLAKRGDVVLFESDLGNAVGVRWSGGVLCIGHNGLNVIHKITPKITWCIQ